jgi:O-antigen ligase
MDDRILRILLAAGIVAIGLLAGWLISRRWHWSAAGPIALLGAAPLVPHLVIAGSVSTDDLFPVLGLALLIITTPPPGLTRSTLMRAGLVAVGLATLARLATTLVHDPSLLSALMGMLAAVLRPLFLVATVAYLAILLRRQVNRAWAACAVGAIGTFEAVFSLAAFMIPLPNIGVRGRLSTENLAGCDLRITGTLGLSPNHIGAVFVVSLPLTIGLAIWDHGWRRWAWAAAGALQATALALTFTRASMIAGGVAVTLLLIYYLQFRIAAVTAVLTVAMLLATTTVACGPGAPQVGPGSGSPEPGVGIPIDRFTDPNDRLALWYAAGRMMLDYPLLGVGIGNMVQVMKQDPARYVFTPFGKAVNSAHNTILLAGAETGVLGAFGTLAINVVIALMALLAFVRRRRYPIVVAAALASVAFLAQGMVNNLFTVPATGTLLAILVGIVAAGGWSADDEPDHVGDPGPGIVERPA